MRPGPAGTIGMNMAERRTRASRAVELGVGVIPTLLCHGPALVYLIFALIVETIPGVLRGGRLDGDWEALFLELLAPVGILVLASLALLIVRGPENVALFGSLFVGARYLRHLPLILRGGPPAERPIAPTIRR